MADTKKYYYLKLKEDFFESDALQIMEAMPDGYLYSNILLKMYLKSLKNDGKLMFNERIPYSPTVLATITRHQVGTVERALKIFKELGLIEILDNGAMYLMDIQNYIGNSSTEADRKRLYRQKIEEERTSHRQVSGQMSGQAKEKSLDKLQTSVQVNAGRTSTRDRDRDRDKDRDINNISTEPETASVPSGVKIILNDKNFYEATEERVEGWKDTYPAVDVMQQLKEMAAWSDANPSRRKTRRGIERFITNWLSKEQDRGGFSRTQHRMSVNQEVEEWGNG